VNTDLNHFVQEHVDGCSAALVVDGNADEIITRLLAEGWTLVDRPSVHCAGKRVRYLQPPTDWTVAVPEPEGQLP
jgi:hypothetical protein